MTRGDTARRHGCPPPARAMAGMRRLLPLLGVAFVLLLAAPGVGIAQPGLKRVALVIGNSAYANAPPLANPRNDAEAMAASLRSLGFIVEEGVDLDRAGMYRRIRAFGVLAESADVALVFYAGHGIQVDGINYLLPTDVSLTRERDLNYEGVPLDLVTSEVAQTRRLGVVILDACRDNPFSQQLARSMGATRSSLVGRGLARVDAAPADTLVAFATRAGAVADDGDGVNSPYTTALLDHLREPGLEIGQYFRKVRDSVLQTTNGRQEPFVYGSLSADQFYLNPGAGPDLQQAAVAATTIPAPPSTTRPDERGMTTDTERLFWDSIDDSTDKADFEAYLRQFPNGVFASLARNRIAQIMANEPAAATGPPEPTETAMVVPPDPVLSDAERREAQVALRRLGLYRGAVDGLFGPGTRAGVRAFQSAIGVAADGRLTPAQLARLRQEAAAAPAPAAVAAVDARTTEAAAPAADAEVAVLPPPPEIGSFGAIAISRGPNPVRRGSCRNQPTQAAADECAVAKCGRTCDARARFGAGQCGAFVESREYGGGEGFGVGDSRGDAIEEAKVACFMDASYNYTCELILSACNE